MNKYLLTLAIAICSLTALADNYYCQYCGARYSSISSMTSSNCPRHPAGSYKGRHTPYTGSAWST